MASFQLTTRTNDGASPARGTRTESFRYLDISDGPTLLDLARSCPIEAGVTFVVERDPDFFSWPRLVFDESRYLGMFLGNRLVGCLLAGFRRAWTGATLGRLLYLGDARVPPKLADEASSRRQ